MGGPSLQSAACPTCPEVTEDEMHIFRCPAYLDLCDCHDLEQHGQHRDEDILSLLQDMAPATCDYIYRAMLRRQDYRATNA